VRIDVQGVGAARGVADTRQGLADVGMIGRPLRPDESDLYATPIARDGLCFVVHKDNPVKELSADQVVRLYTRGATNWREFGGRDAPVVLVQMAEGHSLLELFLDHFRLKTTQLRPDAQVNDSTQALRAVAAQPNAVAFASVGRADSAPADMPVRVLPFAGVAPTAATVRDGTYPLARPLELVTREPPQDLVKEFLDFARAPEVSDLVQKYHFVPLGP
jgi:phosphate transport system substrate-binding protein